MKAMLSVKLLQLYTKMEIVIRDDDVSYFTDPKHLEYLYKDIWDKVPIHLAVIPNVYAGQNEVPLDKIHRWNINIHREDGLIESGSHFWIGKNKPLVKFLKKKMKEGKVKIWQHGTTHEDLDGKYECEWSKSHNGREELEELFDTKIKVFVAPHDRFSKTYIKLIEKNGMDICRGFSPLPREFMFRWKYIDNFLTHFLGGYLFYGTKYRVSYWMDFGKHKELYSYRINHITYKNIDKIIDYHKDGILCITVHHRSLSLEGIEKIKYILRRVK